MRKCSAVGKEWSFHKWLLGHVEVHMGRMYLDPLLVSNKINYRWIRAQNAKGKTINF
jgi:hypothetical protein